jgi:hypothetical protein
MKQLLLVVCGIAIGLFASPRLPKNLEPTSAFGAFVKQWTQPRTPVPEGGMIDPVTGRFVLYQDAHRNAQIPEPRTGFGGLPTPTPEPSSNSAIRDQWGWQARGSLDQPARR